MSAFQTAWSKASLLSALIGLLYAASVSADSSIAIPTLEDAANVNKNSVGIVFTHEELYHQAVHNMEAELEPDSGLRIVPIMGKNHVQSIYDLLYLKGVDFALVRADAVEYVKRYGNFPSVQNVVRNFTKISDEKIVIIANKDIESVEDLNGKTISLGPAGSGEFVTGTILLDSLGIEAKAIEMENSAAAKQMKSGKLAAMVYLLRTPDAVQSAADLDASKRIRNLKSIDKVHVLSVPESEELEAIYESEKLRNSDLPGLIKKGDSVDSYSVDAILAAYNWNSDNPRYGRVLRFVDAFVAGLDGLKSDAYEPVWKRVSLDSETLNVSRLGLVSRVVARQKREEEEARLAEEQRIADELEAEKAAKVEAVTEQRDEISKLLGEKLSTADSAELELLLDELSSFLDKLDTESASAATNN